MRDYKKLIDLLREDFEGYPPCEGCKYDDVDCNAPEGCVYVYHPQKSLEEDAADAIEELLPKQGEWVHQEREFKDGKKIIHYVSSLANCSVCGFEADTEYDVWNFCPNCGAKMFASAINVLNKNDTSGVQV